MVLVCPDPRCTSFKQENEIIPESNANHLTYSLYDYANKLQIIFIYKDIEIFDTLHSKDSPKQFCFVFLQWNH